MRLLIAEDDPVLQFTLTDTASEWGYEVTLAVTGREAYDVLRGDDPPRLALLDWMMPGMNGPEICSRLRDLDDAPFVYTLILTSKSEKKDVARALDAGADDFLSKPVDIDELRSRLAVGRRAVEYEQALTEKNAQLDTYAAEMERLAEERARQLVHAERLALLGTLTAGLAHEIANPISFISGNVTFLHDAWEAAEPCIKEHLAGGVGDERRLQLVLEEAPRAFDGIREGIHRSSQLVTGLKRFSRKGTEGQTRCAMNDCIHNALQLAQNRLRPTVKVEQHLADDCPQIHVNQQQIEQVLVNLFVNAADAMAAGGGGDLVVSSCEEDDRLIVTVEDTGTGIPDAHLESIWEPFFTTKDGDKGTGLGLSISRGIIEEHDGVIWAENRPEGGARFVIELPVA
jgi:two-component system, NtrC family, sensor kinase